jgi:hypothetical protein
MHKHMFFGKDPLNKFLLIFNFKPMPLIKTALRYATDNGTYGV